MGPIRTFSRPSLTTGELVTSPTPYTTFPTPRRSYCIHANTSFAPPHHSTLTHARLYTSGDPLHVGLVSSSTPVPPSCLFHFEKLLPPRATPPDTHFAPSSHHAADTHTDGHAARKDDTKHTDEYEWKNKDERKSRKRKGENAWRRPPYKQDSKWKHRNNEQSKPCSGRKWQEGDGIGVWTGQREKGRDRDDRVKCNQQQAQCQGVKNEESQAKSETRSKCTTSSLSSSSTTITTNTSVSKCDDPCTSRMSFGLPFSDDDDECGKECGKECGSGDKGSHDEPWPISDIVETEDEEGENRNKSGHGSKLLPVKRECSANRNESNEQVAPYIDEWDVQDEKGGKRNKMGHACGFSIKVKCNANEGKSIKNVLSGMDEWNVQYDGGENRNKSVHELKCNECIPQGVECSGSGSGSGSGSELIEQLSSVERGNEGLGNARSETKKSDLRSHFEWRGSPYKKDAVRKDFAMMQDEDNLEPMGSERTGRLEKEEDGEDGEEEEEEEEYPKDGIRVTQRLRPRSYRQFLLTKERRSRVFLKERSYHLGRWFVTHFTHPYPSKDQKDQLAARTSMTRNQVSEWFGNMRRRIREATRGLGVCWEERVRLYNTVITGKSEPLPIQPGDEINTWVPPVNEENSNLDQRDEVCPSPKFKKALMQRYLNNSFETLPVITSCKDTHLSPSPPSTLLEDFSLPNNPRDSTNSTPTTLSVLPPLCTSSPKESFQARWNMSFQNVKVNKNPGTMKADRGGGRVKFLSGRGQGEGNVMMDTGGRVKSFSDRGQGEGSGRVTTGDKSKTLGSRGQGEGNGRVIRKYERQRSEDYTNFKRQRTDGVSFQSYATLRHNSTHTFPSTSTSTSVFHGSPWIVRRAIVDVRSSDDEDENNCSGVRKPEELAAAYTLMELHTDTTSHLLAPSLSYPQALSSSL